MSHKTEEPILSQIHDLVAEEHRLRADHVGVGLRAPDRERLASLEQQLDQCWTLLRQRRADEDLDSNA